MRLVYTYDSDVDNLVEGPPDIYLLESSTHASKMRDLPAPLCRLRDLVLDHVDDARVSDGGQVPELVALASDDLAHDTAHNLIKKRKTKEVSTEKKKLSYGMI